MAAPWTLLYADNVMLAYEDRAELERQAHAWCDRLALFGLKLNVKKTEYLTTDVNELGSIKINGIELSRVTSFKYLGSTITSDGSLKLEVNAGVSAAWSKWRSLSGVLCDRTIPERLKSKVYRTVVRPVATYGAECWPLTKEIESRLSVMETKRLRWTAGVTRLDQVRNDTIRHKFGVAPIAEKLREARFRWYGHVLRANDDTVVAWCDRLALFGLKLNVKKTEYLTTDVNELGSIKINGIELSRVTSFKYLGSTITSDGSLKLEVNAGVSAAWSKWRSLSGVLCDRTIPERLKSKVYRTVVRPVATYGAECWPLTKEIESRLSVMETKRLRWTAGVTRLDQVRNDTIRHKFGVAPIAEKLREARFRWYGHVLRANDDTVVRLA
ncbi:unnamed protein product [Heligmosomoides polygyrus]|uniref:Reverse transcriptase domain-containing protein n=1 Tax=Heligmosomoides polygyrus TaxID=6339 RepID=A0A183FXC0_HELPZ|nr:unnamed protein product [Heligmosomoides polygyrus]